jgi:hypothetical protein
MLDPDNWPVNGIIPADARPEHEARHGAGFTIGQAFRVDFRYCSRLGRRVAHARSFADRRAAPGRKACRTRVARDFSRRAWPTPKTTGAPRMRSAMIDNM